MWLCFVKCIFWCGMFLIWMKRRLEWGVWNMFLWNCVFRVLINFVLHLVSYFKRSHTIKGEIWVYVQCRYCQSIKKHRPIFRNCGCILNRILFFWVYIPTAADLTNYILLSAVYLQLRPSISSWQCALNFDPHVGTSIAAWVQTFGLKRIYYCDLNVLSSVIAM